jgi:hypothetical protein
MYNGAVSIKRLMHMENTATTAKAFLQAETESRNSGLPCSFIMLFALYLSRINF